jgi:hypothetical protein
VKRDSSGNCDRVSRTPANAQTGVWAAPRAKQESVAKRSQRIEERLVRSGRRTGVTPLGRRRRARARRPNRPAIGEWSATS